MSRRCTPPRHPRSSSPWNPWWRAWRVFGRHRLFRSPSRTPWHLCHPWRTPTLRSAKARTERHPYGPCPFRAPCGTLEQADAREEAADPKPDAA
eukprot:2060557-Lingulodinium_polyedra.AAC.1